MLARPERRQIAAGVNIIGTAVMDHAHQGVGEQFLVALVGMQAQFQGALPGIVQVVPQNAPDGNAESA